LLSELDESSEVSVSVALQVKQAVEDLPMLNHKIEHIHARLRRLWRVGVENVRLTKLLRLTVEIAVCPTLSVGAENGVGANPGGVHKNLQG
jgi:hypothetical protein